MKYSYLSWNALTIASAVALIASCAQVPPTQYKALQSFQDTLTDGSPGPVMIVVPTGHYVMGSTSKEGQILSHSLPPHKVTIKQSFAIGKLEISFKEYDQFVKATDYEKPSDLGWGSKQWGRNKTPVFNVSWTDAQQYLKWLSRETGAHYRLPSEAEWEYVARSGSTTIFHTGDCINSNQANFHDKETYFDCSPSGVYRGKAIDTGSFSANDWGLHDIHGNVLEWTQDCWHPNYNNAPGDGSAWLDDEENVNCDRRVLRGGSWSGRAIELGSAARAHNSKDYKSIFIGFRVVRDLK